MSWKDVFYDGEIKGWLTLNFLPKTETVWFPVDRPTPSFDINQNCYMGIGLRQKNLGTWKRGEETDIIAIPGLWLDLDFNSQGAHKAKGLPTEAEAHELLESAPYEPSIVVHSGHGLQAYWLFNETWVFEGNADRERAKSLNEGWQLWFQDKARKFGWHVDSTADLARILRIPGTYNCKTEPHRLAEIIQKSGKRYEPSDFDDFPLVGTNVLQDRRLPERVRSLILNGDTDGTHPSRSEAVYSVTMQLFNTGYTHGEILEILMNPQYKISEKPIERGEKWLLQDLNRISKKFPKDAQALLEGLASITDTGDEILPIFLNNRMEVPEGLARDFLYPGGVTLVAAPAGIGKSVVAHILARELASGGIFRGGRLDKANVLLIDTDNPRVMLQDRLSKVCVNHDISLSVRTREKSPPLSDAEFWKALPVTQYDVVILDSFGGATPGISEKEAGPYQKAIGVIRDIADRGPAVLVLDNTTKSAENYRGRGEKIERFDVIYECRDVTGWTPNRADWWAALPEAGDSFWQERATRRKGAKKVRLAFMARKFRWDEEPDPFVLEISFDTLPWGLEDITEAIDHQAKGASLEQKREHQLKQLDAVHACATEINRRVEAGEPVMSKTEAEEVMKEASGLTRAEIRRLLDAHDVNTYPSDGRWRIESLKKGKKGVLNL